jgi:HSP20 family protein
MSLIHMEPFRELSHAHERFNHLFDDAFRNVGRRQKRWVTSEAWRPPVNVLETDESLVLELELPGLERDELHLEVEDGTLTIKGERKEEHGEDGGRWLRVERYHGAFERSFALPTTVDPEGIRASLRNGVLQVTLPKRSEAARRSVSINS